MTHILLRQVKGRYQWWNHFSEHAAFPGNDNVMESMSTLQYEKHI